MEYFSVKNHKKFQHYKNRTPPWIKLHRTIFTDYEFSCLQDASKLHLILIWLLASEMDNKIPYDPDWVQKRLGLQKPVNLKALKEKGFIAVDSVMLAECLQGARAEGEGEGYKQETDKKKTCPKFDEFQTAWESYPQKDGRKKAYGYYKASVKNQEGHDRLMMAMEKYKRSVDVRPRPWKNGATFFNNWQDFEKWVEPESDGNGNQKLNLGKVVDKLQEWADEQEPEDNGRMIT